MPALMNGTSSSSVGLHLTASEPNAVCSIPIVPGHPSHFSSTITVRSNYYPASFRRQTFRNGQPYGEPGPKPSMGQCKKAPSFNCHRSHREPADCLHDLPPRRCRGSHTDHPYHGRIVPVLLDLVSRSVRPDVYRGVVYVQTRFTRRTRANIGLFQVSQLVSHWLWSM